MAINRTVMETSLAITPTVNRRLLIDSGLTERNMSQVICGFGSVARLFVN